MTELSNNDKSKKSLSTARVSLGRYGLSIGVREQLAFNLDHARARDAVYSVLEIDSLVAGLNNLNLKHAVVHSIASDREEFLQYPEKGRKLSTASRVELTPLETDLVILLADGLSAEAINLHAIPLLTMLIPELTDKGYSLAPIFIAQQGRVALGDEVGAVLKSKLLLVLIGERPGLSAPTSMGAYITWNPVPGTTNDCRNCVSNIHHNGLPYAAATHKLLYYINEAFRRKLTGVRLKEEGNTIR